MVGNKWSTRITRSTVDPVISKFQGSFEEKMFGYEKYNEEIISSLINAHYSMLCTNNQVFSYERVGLSESIMLY